MHQLILAITQTYPRSTEKLPKTTAMHMSTAMRVAVCRTRRILVLVLHSIVMVVAGTAVYFFFQRIVSFPDQVCHRAHYIVH